MDAELKLNKIFLEVEKLDKFEQLSLLRKLTQLVKGSNSPKKSVTLADISGLGSEVWRGIDIEKYLDVEREW